MGKLYGLFLQCKDFQECCVNAMGILFMNARGHIINWAMEESNRSSSNIYFYLI